MSLLNNDIKLEKQTILKNNNSFYLYINELIFINNRTDKDKIISGIAGEIKKVESKKASKLSKSKFFF